MPMIKKVVDYNGKIMNASVYEGDYTLARKFGKVMVGKRALYYQDGLKIVCVPFDKMDRSRGWWEEPLPCAAAESGMNTIGSWSFIRGKKSPVSSSEKTVNLWSRLRPI